MARKIAILGGTGAEGSGLACRLAKAGEHILIGSREAVRAQETARLLRERIGSAAQIDGTDNPSAAAACDVAVLTVPFSGIVALLKQLKSVWKPRFRILARKHLRAMGRSTATCWCAAMMRRPSRWPLDWSARFRERGH